MPPENTSKIPTVFVHGLWLHAESWNSWMQFFRERGYQATAASWPGDSATTEATRKNAAAVAGFGVTETAPHIPKQLEALGQQPILIGHPVPRRRLQNLRPRDL